MLLNEFAKLVPLAELFQTTSVPSERRAMALSLLPAAMATMFVRPAGRFVPAPLPHATTEPSPRRARLQLSPPAIAITLLKPGGTMHCLCWLLPQAATGPIVSNATLLVAEPPPLDTIIWYAPTLLKLTAGFV